MSEVKRYRKLNIGVDGPMDESAGEWVEMIRSADYDTLSARHVEAMRLLREELTAWEDNQFVSAFESEQRMAKIRAYLGKEGA